MSTKILLALLAAWAAHAQVQLTCTPQPAPVAGLTEWNCQLCAPTAQTVPGGAVYAAASRHLRYLRQATVTERYRTAAALSRWRIAGLVTEGAAWLAQGLVAGNVLKIREASYRSAPGAGALLLRTASTLVKRDAPRVEVPANLLGPWVSIPASAGTGSCSEAVIVGLAQPGEESWAEILW